MFEPLSSSQCDQAFTASSETVQSFLRDNTPRNREPFLDVGSPHDEAESPNGSLESAPSQTSSKFNRIGFLLLVCLALMATFSLFSQRQITAQNRKLFNSLESLRNIVSKRSEAVLITTGYLCEEMQSAKYLLDRFAGDARCDIREIGIPGNHAAKLILTCEKRPAADGPYAGINLFGNTTVTAGFDPIDLSEIEEISFQYRYPQSGKSLFNIRLKNIDGDETRTIAIGTLEDRGGWQTFRLTRSNSPELAFLADSTERSSLLLNFSIFSELQQSDREEIELRQLQFIRRGS